MSITRRVCRRGKKEIEMMRAKFAAVLFSWVSLGQAGAAERGLWEKPVVIGASVADGCNMSDLAGPKSQALSFDLFLDRAVTADHGAFENKGSMMFFMSAEGVARKQSDFVKAAAPTVVISPDFLFWFLYGELETEGKRLELFEKGLEHLESIACPLVVGDIPNARHVEGGILSKKQIPAASTIEKANKRVREWAAEKKNVGLIPVSEFMRTVWANEALVVRGREVPEGQSAKLLQTDGLHPEPEGVELIALAALDVLQTLTGFAEGDVAWAADPAAP